MSRLYAPILRKPSVDLFYNLGAQTIFLIGRGCVLFVRLGDWREEGKNEMVEDYTNIKTATGCSSFL